MKNTAVRPVWADELGQRVYAFALRVVKLVDSLSDRRVASKVLSANWCVPLPQSQPTTRKRERGQLYGFRVQNGPSRQRMPRVRPMALPDSGRRNSPPLSHDRHHHRSPRAAGHLRHVSENGPPTTRHKMKPQVFLNSLIPKFLNF